MKETAKYIFLEYFYIIVGSFITAFGITVFLNPAQIAPGGVSGIATIYYHLFGWDLSLVMLLHNIPLFIIGVALFGKQFGAKSLLGALLLSVGTTVCGAVFGYEGILDMTKDINIWLCALLGGVTTGIGLGLVLKSGSNTGGTDILAQVIARFTHIPLGTSLFLVDGCIIVSSLFVFGVESMIYAIIVAYITQVMINKVVLSMGTNYAKTAFIISDKMGEIRDFILNDLDRSGTLIKSKGLYSMEEKDMLMVVIPNRTVTKLTRFVEKTDPNAFLIINETYHVFGEGHTSIEEFVARNKDVTQDT